MFQTLRCLCLVIAVSFVLCVVCCVVGVVCCVFVSVFVHHIAFMCSERLLCRHLVVQRVASQYFDLCVWLPTILCLISVLFNLSVI